MFRLIQYNLLHFLGIYQRAAVMGIVCIKASYRNVTNQTEKTGLAPHQYVESFPNSKLVSGFSALILQTVFWKVWKKSCSTLCNTQHSHIRLSYTIITKGKLLGKKGKFGLVNFVVVAIFGVWVL